MTLCISVLYVYILSEIIHSHVKLKLKNADCKFTVVNCLQHVQLFSFLSFLSIILMYFNLLPWWIQKCHIVSELIPKAHIYFTFPRLSPFLLNKKLIARYGRTSADFYLIRGFSPFYYCSFVTICWVFIIYFSLPRFPFLHYQVVYHHASKL